MLGITLEGWLTIVAVILGPILALWAQRISERRRELRQRKLTIFKELMATRAPSGRVSPRHVDALNAIEIEFSSGRGRDKRVLDTWRLFLDHLNSTSFNSDDKQAVVRWNEKCDDLLTDLLYEMSEALGFNFDKVASTIRKPMATLKPISTCSENSCWI